MTSDRLKKLSEAFQAGKVREGGSRPKNGRYQASVSARWQVYDRINGSPEGVNLFFRVVSGDEEGAIAKKDHILNPEVDYFQDSVDKLITDFTRMEHPIDQSNFSPDYMEALCNKLSGAIVDITIADKNTVKDPRFDYVVFVNGLIENAPGKEPSKATQEMEEELEGDQEMTVKLNTKPEQTVRKQRPAKEEALDMEDELAKEFEGL